MESFRKENPNIKIKREVLFGEDYYKALLNYYRENEILLDVFYMVNDNRYKTIYNMTKNLVPFLIEDGIISKNSFNISYEDANYHFANNESVYFIDGDWRTSSFIKTPATISVLLSKERQENDIDFMLFPSLPNEVLSASTSGSLKNRYAMVSTIEKGSEKEKTIWKVIKWLTGLICQ